MMRGTCVIVSSLENDTIKYINNIRYCVAEKTVVLGILFDLGSGSLIDHLIREREWSMNPISKDA